MDVAPEDDGSDRSALTNAYHADFKSAMQTPGKHDRGDAIKALRKTERWAMSIPDPKADDAVDAKRFKSVWHDLEENVIRELIMAGTRPDGRDRHDTLARNPVAKRIILPTRPRFSAVFQRGETQSLGHRDARYRPRRATCRRFGGRVYSKKFMLDYNFPSI